MLGRHSEQRAGDHFRVDPVVPSRCADGEPALTSSRPRTSFSELTRASYNGLLGLLLERVRSGETTCLDLTGRTYQLPAPQIVQQAITHLNPLSQTVSGSVVDLRLVERYCALEVIAATGVAPLEALDRKLSERLSKKPRSSIFNILRALTVETQIPTRRPPYSNRIKTEYMPQQRQLLRRFFTQNQGNDSALALELNTTSQVIGALRAESGLSDLQPRQHPLAFTNHGFDVQQQIERRLLTVIADANQVQAAQTLKISRSALRRARRRNQLKGPDAAEAKRLNLQVRTRAGFDLITRFFLAKPEEGSLQPSDSIHSQWLTEKRQQLSQSPSNPLITNRASDREGVHRIIRAIYHSDYLGKGISIFALAEQIGLPESRLRAYFERLELPFKSLEDPRARIGVCVMGHYVNQLLSSRMGGDLARYSAALGIATEILLEQLNSASRGAPVRFVANGYGPAEKELYRRAFDLLLKEYPRFSHAEIARRIGVKSVALSAFMSWVGAAALASGTERIRPVNSRQREVLSKLLQFFQKGCERNDFTPDEIAGISNEWVRERLARLSTSTPLVDGEESSRQQMTAVIRAIHSAYYVRGVKPLQWLTEQTRVAESVLLSYFARHGLPTRKPNELAERVILTKFLLFYAASEERSEFLADETSEISRDWVVDRIGLLRDSGPALKDDEEDKRQMTAVIRGIYSAFYLRSNRSLRWLETHTGVDYNSLLSAFARLELPRRTTSEYFANLRGGMPSITRPSHYKQQLTFKESGEERFAALSPVPSVAASDSEEAGLIVAAMSKLALQDSFAHTLIQSHIGNGMSLHTLGTMWKTPVSELAERIQSGLEKLRQIIGSLED